MNAAKAASRMRSRTAASSPPSRRRFDIDAVAITLSLTTLVPYSTTIFSRLVSFRELRVFASFFDSGRNLFSSRASKPACGTPRYHTRSKFREESKELNNEDGNVLPVAGIRDGPGAPGARPVHTATAQDHRRADDPFAKTGGYGRASHENHARRNSCDRSPVSRRQDSAVVHARRRQGRHLPAELQRRSGGPGPHRKPASLKGKPGGRAVHSGRATLAARDTLER